MTAKGPTAPRAGGLRSPAAEAGVCAMGFMAVVPAHLMRSVGGGYDNESVAVTAMTLTFWLWMRSLRGGDPNAHLVGVLAGLAYFYMVAAWGGYIFVLNVIAAHAGLLVLLGRFSDKVYKAYTLFYMVGTTLAVQVPVVGWAPLKSLEQLPAAAAFIVVVAVPQSYFGPISSRVRGLFVPHTKTGNPLVDSVAEHQAASNQAYWQYLQGLCFLAPAGFVITLGRFGDANAFLFVYSLAAYFFSHKMVRLILLTAPIASALGGSLRAACWRGPWGRSWTPGTTMSWSRGRASAMGPSPGRRRRRKSRTTPLMTPARSPEWRPSAMASARRVPPPRAGSSGPWWPWSSSGPSTSRRRPSPPTPGRSPPACPTPQSSSRARRVTGR